MGVSILPKFAAIVCNTTTGTASFRTASSPDRQSTVNVKGTKVINATSFVINMLKKKHSNTRISASAITLWVCCNNILATLRNMPSFCNPAITVIRQNKIASVRKSIYPIYSLSGGIITADNTANTIAAVSTVSFFITFVLQTHAVYVQHVLLFKRHKALNNAACAAGLFRHGIEIGLVYAYGRERAFKPKRGKQELAQPLYAGEAAPEPLTHGRQVIALSGIGNPKPFLQSLRERYEVVAEMTLDDHHVYKVRDMHALEALLSEHPGAVIVTTEKDAVKMTRREKVPEAVRRTLYYQPINISFIEDSATDFLQKLEEDVRGN